MTQKTKTHKYFYALITISLLFVASNDIEKRVNAVDTNPYELGSIISLDDSKQSKNIVSSSIDSVCVTPVSTTEKSTQFVEVYFNMALKDWTGATDFILKVENNFWADSAASISLLMDDGTWSFYCLDAQNTAWENRERENNTAFYYNNISDAISNTNVKQTRNGFYNITPVPGAFSGYMRIPLSSMGDRYGDKSSPTVEKLKNVIKMQIVINTTNDFGARFNIGEIGFLRNNEYVKAFDAKNATFPTGYADDAQCWDPEQVYIYGNYKNVLLQKLSANQIAHDKRYVENNGNWSSFYMLQPMDISAYNGISYYIDNTLEENKSIFFNKYLREWDSVANTSGEEWYCDGGFAQYHPEDGEEFIGDANIIPANFKGRVTIPFSNFAIPGWYTPKDGKLDLTSIWWNFGFTFDVNRTNEAKTFIIKDFRLERDARQFIRLEQKVTNVGDVKNVFAMEYYDDFDLKSDWFTSWNLAADCEISLVDNPSSGVGYGNKAMNFVCGNMKEMLDHSYETALEHYPNASQVDFKDAKGLTFWIKNTSTKQLVFNIGFDIKRTDNGDRQQRWQMAPDCRYQMFNTKTNKECLANGKWGLCIPANFEGWIRMEFSQFINPTWETSNGSLDTNMELAYFVINMNADIYSGYSFILDSLGFYYSDVDIVTTFNKNPDNSFEKAIGKE